MASQKPTPRQSIAFLANPVCRFSVPIGKANWKASLILLAMTIQSISAVTLTVQDMAQSVAFYRKIGLTLARGGHHARFTTFQAGQGFINLIHASPPSGSWGRVILRVQDVDALHDRLLAAGLKPDSPPRDAAWGERYFHLKDPDGHELSFAQLL